jgi:hypothetical protein
MSGRSGKKDGADSTQLDDDDEGGAGLLNKSGNHEDEDGEGEGAGLLPMDADKTLAMVICKRCLLLVSASPPFCERSS